MIATLSGFKEVVLQVLSEQPLVLPTHWIGRTVLCGGEGCKACEFETCRRLAWLGAAFGKRRCVLEVPYALASDVLVEKERIYAPTLTGMCVKLQRRDKRAPWKIVGSEMREPVNSVVTLREILCDVARLFKVDPPEKSESSETWWCRVRLCHQLLISQRFLFV